MRGPGAEFAPQDSLRPRTSQIFFLVRELTIFCPLLFIFHPRALSSPVSLLSQILALSIYGQSTEEVTGSVERLTTKLLSILKIRSTKIVLSVIKNGLMRILSRALVEPNALFVHD